MEVARPLGQKKGLLGLNGLYIDGILVLVSSVAQPDISIRAPSGETALHYKTAHTGTRGERERQRARERHRDRKERREKKRQRRVCLAFPLGCHTFFFLLFGCWRAIHTTVQYGTAKYASNCHRSAAFRDCCRIRYRYDDVHLLHVVCLFLFHPLV